MAFVWIVTVGVLSLNIHCKGIVIFNKKKIYGAKQIIKDGQCGDCC